MTTAEGARSSGADNFEGRRALVTGAGSGIGLSIVTKLLERGADVVAFDLDPSAVPAEVTKVAVDLSDVTAVREAVASLNPDEPIDTLFNNAGIGSTKNLVDCSVEEWDRVFDVNVRATFLMCQLLLPSMLERQHGVIVNTASVAGMIGLTDRAAYCASKGAVIALTKQIAVQWAGHGIRCNSVCPGTVDSPWVGRLMAEAEDPEARRAQLVGRQPLGRLGKPEEIASAAIYLASDAAAFITGTDLVIDGGITAA
ncbi:short-chain dehydrogenase [Nocardioides baekrokdamisoli]|uniref:Short-chain dehydrogenase n=1 Tax=Nocardioides baekrokdamisoli TaxID=1804624 RepID=A0A3G9IV60_9ACTN|nr:SDR family NAD(P)-dependent oxidoreductase [Nocardioides baekrokdamisoli]BBH17551.1 short-chain dehydrogenase [Nocardioides baekrokdamisoli]